MQALDTAESVAFGPFVLDLSTRTLVARGEKVTLSSRGFDILALLVAAHDRVVSKDEIITAVWRGLAVEENNLAVQISALRRALAEHAEGQTIILTVPGQGYRFVGKLDLPAEAPQAAAEPPPAMPMPPQFLPQDFSAPPSRRSRWPWAVGAMAVAAIAAGISWQSRGMKEAPRLSIAVLPFRNLSDDRSQDYLADAISDDLTTDLAHLPGSVVIARESSDVYKGHAAPAQQIGRALNVRYLLEGSLRLVENTFSVNAQLIDASTGAHLWATQFPVPRDKLHDAQMTIVGNIGSALHVKLVEVESDRSLKERPDNPDAEDLFLRARSLHDRAVSIEDLAAAQKLLEQALYAAPRYVPALTELSHVLLDKQTDFDDPSEAADLTEATQLADQALSLSPHDDNALTAKARLSMIAHRIAEAEASYQAAIAANPNNVAALGGLVSCNWKLGKPEAALGPLRQQIQLDPQGANTRRYHATLGYTYFLLGKWQDSIEWLQRSLAEGAYKDKSDLGLGEWSHLFLMAAYETAGDDGRARSLFSEYGSNWRNRSVWRLSAYFYKPLSEHPGFQTLMAALRQLGMPMFAQGAGDAVPNEARQGDFDPPPQDLAGAAPIGLPQLQALRHATPAPLIIDVDKGAAMLPGTLAVPYPDAPSGGIADALKHREPGAPVIIIGGGWFGWSAVHAVRSLAGVGIHPVLWLKGGEETLAASGDPSVVNGRTP